jgi:hypothetical protein
MLSMPGQGCILAIKMAAGARRRAADGFGSAWQNSQDGWQSTPHGGHHCLARAILYCWARPYGYPDTFGSESGVLEAVSSTVPSVTVTPEGGNPDNCSKLGISVGVAPLTLIYFEIRVKSPFALNACIFASVVAGSATKRDLAVDRVLTKARLFVVLASLTTLL